MATGLKRTKPKRKQARSSVSASRRMLDLQRLPFICSSCGEVEEMPLGVVQDFDRMGMIREGAPPCFGCNRCGGNRYPLYYRSICGSEFRAPESLIRMAKGLDPEWIENERSLPE